MKRQFVRSLILLSAIYALYFILGAALSPRGRQAAGRFGSVSLEYESVLDGIWEISPESWLPDTSADTKTYRLTLTVPNTGIAGIVLPVGTYGPDIIINGSGEIPTDQANRSVYGSSGYAAYFFDTSGPAEIMLKYGTGAPNTAPPTVFVGTQGAAVRMLESVYAYGLVCAGACITTAAFSFAWYVLSYRRLRHVFCGISAIAAALFFVFSPSGIAAPMFPYLSAAASVKIWYVCAAALTAMYALISGRFFAEKLNKWVILAFWLYCTVCAVIFVVAPLSAHESVLKVFAACTAGFLGYVFVALLANFRESNTVRALWLLVTIMCISLIVWGLTSSSFNPGYIYPAVITLVSAAALCQWLAPALNVKRGLASPAVGDESTEAGKIVGRLSYLKSELYENLPDDIKAFAGSPREYAPYPPRRVLGLTDEEALLRDLKNITAESNRLSLLATRIVQALSANEQTEFQKVQLTKCAEKSYDIYAHMFDDKNNAVSLETDSWLPFVGADENLVMQSMFHMLTNANERTENGTVNIYVTRSENKQAVEFRMHDDGDVIPADMLALLFSDGSDAAAEPAIADLYLARSVAENFGGSLTVVSTLRGGTTMTFALPDYREEGL